jgi:uncharacterized membrane protein
MVVDLKILFGVITGLAIGWAIYFILRKRTDEPERDERTEKIGCKAAKNTIIVIMGVLGIIGWGDILGVFKLETSMAVSLVFFALMISMFGFLRYYNSKEV